MMTCLEGISFDPYRDTFDLVGANQSINREYCHGWPSDFLDVTTKLLMLTEKGAEAPASD
jgi:hypothetical protein